MKFSSKQSTDKKMNFSTIKKTELHQVKGGGKDDIAHCGENDID